MNCPTTPSLDSKGVLFLAARSDANSRCYSSLSISPAEEADALQLKQNCVDAKYLSPVWSLHWHHFHSPCICCTHSLTNYSGYYCGVVVCQVYVGICYFLTGKALSILLTILLDKANQTKKLLEVVITTDRSVFVAPGPEKKLLPGCLDKTTFLLGKQRFIPTCPIVKGSAKSSAN